ncbi:hypothetical protein ACFC0C_16115 [Streptomyces sp. NPDC056178]|uniref:hypothetical protein n=1 Tax=unclassified Streptomyces TaxID=2593676 RepID=UPI0035E28504
MRLRSLTVLGLITLTALALPGCSNSPSAGTAPGSPAAKTGPEDGKSGNHSQGTPLSSAVLRDRLLN